MKPNNKKLYFYLPLPNKVFVPNWRVETWVWGKWEGQLQSEMMLSLHNTWSLTPLVISLASIRFNNSLEVLVELSAGCNNGYSSRHLRKEKKIDTSQRKRPTGQCPEGNRSGTCIISLRGLRMHYWRAVVCSRTHTRDPIVYRFFFIEPLSCMFHWWLIDHGVSVFLLSGPWPKASIENYLISPCVVSNLHPMFIRYF